MTQLPSNPSLKHLRLEAKSILKAHKSGDVSCCKVLRHLHQFKDKSDDEILKATAGLQEVQFALALEYGFKCWSELKTHVQGEAEVTGHVTREGSRIWVEGVPNVQLGERWDMLLCSLEVILRQRGSKTSLKELMVYSGDAFSLSHSTNWQYMAYLFIPTNTLGNATSLLGYEHRWLQSHLHGLSKEAKVKETLFVLAEIWKEIDAGRAVMVGGCADQGCAKWSIVVGYDKENLQMCHNGIGGQYRWTGIRGVNIDLNPDAKDTGYWNGRLRGQVGGHIGGWLDNLAFVVGSKTTSPSDHENISTILKRAAELFYKEKIRIGAEFFYFGQQAYEQWAKDLAELDFPADTKKEIPAGSWGLYSMENIDYMVDLIMRGRTAAVDYLEKMAESFPACKSSLCKAALHYRDEVEILKRAFAVYIPPWSGNDAVIEKWLGNKDCVTAGAHAILQMLGKERSAVAEIEKALATLE